MAFRFHRGLSIPLWVIAVSAVALGTMPGAIALLGIAVVGFTIPAMAKWLRPSRPLMDVLPAIGRHPARAGGLIVAGGTHTRTLEEAVQVRAQAAADAADDVRMDDDGGPRRVLPADTAMAGSVGGG
jgi:hypothetical protein